MKAIRRPASEYVNLNWLTFGHWAADPRTAPGSRAPGAVPCLFRRELRPRWLTRGHSGSPT